jgi:GTPase SAR1 family protein
MNRAYFRGALGAVMVYDVTRPETFSNVVSWVNEFRELGDPDAVIVLVGNKVSPIRDFF